MLHEYLVKPLGLLSTADAAALVVTPARINEIVRGRRGIIADTTVRLAHYFHTGAQSWVNLQDHYDLAIAEQESEAALRAVRPMDVA